MRSIDELKKLSAAAKAERYPLVPDYALPRTKVKTSTANGLTKAIVDWLILNGCWATRVSSAGRYLPLMGKYIPSTTKRGTADIHAVIGGKHVSIEVKVGKDRMSEAQRKVKADVERSGGVYFVARSFDEFVTFYNYLKKYQYE